MSQEKIILLCDDTEIKGNGDGSVRELILNPLERYVKNLTKSNLKATFFVDMAHFLYLEKHEKTSIDYLCFIKAIQLLFNSGMDVQLHLHPQWFIRIKEPHRSIDTRWNLGLLEDDELRELVSSSKHRLEVIGKSFKKDYRVLAFKAGSWGLMPFQKVLTVLNENQIELVIGPCGNISLPGLKVDYSSYRSQTGIKVQYNSNLMLMTEIRHSIIDILFLGYGVLRKKKKVIIESENSLKRSPLQSASLSYIKGMSFVTHLRMNWQSPWYIIRVLKKYFKSNPGVNYAYIEMHTKDFGEDQLESPSKFREHLGTDCLFLTVSEYAANYI